MNRFCDGCGTAIEPGERFCGNCGKPVAGAAPAAPPAANWPPPPPAPVASWSAAAAAAPAPAYSGGPLPPSPQPWEFQKTVATQGESIVRSMGLAKPGQRMGLIEMMVRGAFLDARVYRQAALDAGGNQNAAIAVGLTFLAAVLGGYLISLSLPGFGSLIFIAGSVLAQVVAYVAGVGVMAAVSQSILGRKLEFGHIFRAMSYAQSPGVLAFIPALGQLLGLWRIPTSLVAIREISACEGAKAAILLIIGAVASTVAALALSPVIMAAFAFMR